MKVKFIITSILFSIFLAGCRVSAVDYISYNDEVSRYEARMIVSQVLQSQSLVNEASVSTSYHNSYIDGYLQITYEEDLFNDTLSISSYGEQLHLTDPYYYTQTYLNDIHFDYTYDNYIDEYVYSYSGSLNNAQVGWLSFETIEPFYGLDSQNPDYGSLKITNDDVIIYIDVVDAYYVDITLYNHYDYGYYDQFRTTWYALGF